MQHLEQQAALHKERARITKDIHDDLGANLTQIALLGELARQDTRTGNSGVPGVAGERLSLQGDRGSTGHHPQHRSSALARHL